MKLTKQFIGILFPVCLFLGLASDAQVGIGTNTPNASAVLDVSGATGGLLPPRMTQDQMNAIVVSPAAEGLIVYCIDCSPKGVYYYDGNDFLNSRTGMTSRVVSTTGRVWMDRNLGASRVALSSTDAASYGDLYQWGRAADGHEKRTSGTTNTLSSSDVPGHGDFIFSPDQPDHDWRSLSNDNLWQGVYGINNPCPEGYRLPTEPEWVAEFYTWTPLNADGAFASPLKLPVAGYRTEYNEVIVIEKEAYAGFYWSSTASTDASNNSIYLEFGPGLPRSVEMRSFPRSTGLSVRCIKEKD